MLKVVWSATFFFPLRVSKNISEDPDLEPKQSNLSCKGPYKSDVYPFRLMGPLEEVLKLMTSWFGLSKSLMGEVSVESECILRPTEGSKK